MHATPLTRRTARLVLAWFVAFLVVAGIAPLVQAQPLDSICTATSVAKASGQTGGGESDMHAGHTLKCSLCTGATAPPSASATLPPLPADLRHATRPLVAAHLASLAGAPLPARGPPLFS